MLSKNRIVKKALRHLKRGEIDKAINAYVKALEVDGNDTKILVRLAVLYRKQDKVQEAIQYYMQAAGQFNNEGYFDKALSIYNQIIQLDDSIKDAFLKSAEIYTRLNNIYKATEHYQRLAKLYEDGDMLWEAIEAMEKIRSIDPGNFSIAAKLSDYYYDNDMHRQGYAAIKPAMIKVREAGNKKQHLTLLKKVAQISPRNIENFRELTEFYLENECVALAYKALVEIYRHQPEDILVLRKLADIAIEKKWREQAVVALRKLKSVYKESGLQGLSGLIEGVDAEINEIMPDDMDPDAEIDYMVAIEYEGDICEVTDADESAEPASPVSSAEPVEADIKPKPVEAAEPKPAPEKEEVRVELKEPKNELSYYKDLAVQHEEQGKVVDAIEVMEKIHSIDPDNLAVSAKLSDLYFMDDRLMEGYVTIKPVVDRIRDAGDDKHYLALMNKVAERNPDNTQNLREMADFFVAKDYPARAYNALSKVNRIEPDDTEVIRKLADLAIERGWNDHAVANLNQLKSIYEEKGLKDLVSKTIGEILGVMPEVDVSEVEVKEHLVDIDVADAISADEVEMREDKLLPSAVAPVDEKEIIPELQCEDPDIFEETFDDLYEREEEPGKSGFYLLFNAYPGQEYKPDSHEEKILDSFRPMVNAWAGSPSETEPLQSDLELDKEFKDLQISDIYEEDMTDETGEVSLDEFELPADAEERAGELPRPEDEARDVPETKIYETAIFCPFPPVTELMADAPGSNKEQSSFRQANIYTMSLKEAHISLVGPAPGPKESSLTLEWMIDAGARNIFILELCEYREDVEENAGLVIYPKDADESKPSPKRAHHAILEAFNDRGMKCHPFMLEYDDEKNAYKDGGLVSASVDTGEMFSLAQRRGVDLGCVMVPSKDFAQIRKEKALPSTHSLIDIWNACYVVIDAAFKIS